MQSSSKKITIVFNSTNGANFGTLMKFHSTNEGEAPFGIKVFLKYRKNISVSGNIEVLNTLRCLNPII